MVLKSLVFRYTPSWEKMMSIIGGNRVSIAYALWQRRLAHDLAQWHRREVARLKPTFSFNSWLLRALAKGYRKTSQHR